jgi:hypothetical protein
VQAIAYMDAPRAGGRTSSGYFTCRKHILSEKKVITLKQVKSITTGA